MERETRFFSAIFIGMNYDSSYKLLYFELNKMWNNYKESSKFHNLIFALIKGYKFFYQIFRKEIFSCISIIVYQKKTIAS